MSFWDSSWERVDGDRITDYIDTFDMGTDAMVTTLRQYGAKNVCDAGCGCGIYALKLAANGFSVSGFDISAHAVAMAQALLEKQGYSGDFQTASVLATGYAPGQFDGVISRDVLDHMERADAVAAIAELCRITKPGGIVLFTLDSLDEEYETEPHRVNADGDYVFTDGKWKGMIFHPYTREEIGEMIPTGVRCEILDSDGELTVLLQKSHPRKERSL